MHDQPATSKTQQNPDTSVAWQSLAAPQLTLHRKASSPGQPGCWTLSLVGSPVWHTHDERLGDLLTEFLDDPAPWGHQLEPASDTTLGWREVLLWSERGQLHMDLRLPDGTWIRAGRWPLIRTLNPGSPA